MINDHSENWGKIAMAQLTLYIGNKNFSSWSFRAWLALKSVGLTFKEVLIPLNSPDTKSSILKVSPSGFVPCLHHGSLKIHDSLAIAEYVHELCPEMSLIPSDSQARAVSRSVCSEMHSGFLNLRREFPMNMKHRETKIPSVPVSQDIKRIYEIWETTKSFFGRSGPFLFGDWSIADVFFSPVVSRFISYDVKDNNFKNYMMAVSNSKFYQEWYKGAVIEP